MEFLLKTTDWREINAAFTEASRWLVKHYQTFPIASTYFGYILDELEANIRDHAKAASVRLGLMRQKNGVQVTVAVTEAEFYAIIEAR